jgi:hypothetical protein
MAAVLIRALEDVLDKKAVAATRREALDWIFSDADDYELTFSAVCGYLRLDPDVVRRRVLREGLIPHCLLPTELTLPDQLQYGHGSIFEP